MFNTNIVDLTVQDYSGTLTVKAVCADGGVFASGAEQTVSVEAGRTATLAPIRFVPLKTGNVSYTIEVYTTDGRKIGSTVVANTITATKLTPKIRVYYAEPEQQHKYSLDEGYITDSTGVYWYGYTKIKADVTFAPTLDYPEPLAGKTLAKVKLKPSPSVNRLVSEYDILDTGPIWLATWMFLDSNGCPDLNEIEVVYAPEATPKTYCLMDIGRIPNYEDQEHYPSPYYTQLFAPYTEGYNDLILPVDEANLDYGRLENVVFVYYNFSDRHMATQVSVSGTYQGLEIDTNDPDKFVINEIGSY